MKTHNWKVLAAGALTSLILAGCGGSGGSSAQSGPTGSSVVSGQGGGINSPEGPGGPVGPGNGAPVVFNPGGQTVLVSISASPSPLTLNVSQTQQLTITGTDSGGGTVSIVPSSGVSITYTVTGTAVSVSSTGLVTTNAPGSATITVQVTTGGQTLQTVVPVTVISSTGAPVITPLANGDFSTGDLTSWTQVTVAGGSFSGFPHFTVTSGAPFLPAQNGNDYFSLDVPGGASGYIFQNATVPSGSNVLLRYRDWGGLDPVNAYVSAGGLSENFVPPPLESSPGVASGNTDEQRSLDVTSLQGQTVEIRLGGSATGVNGTAANFDDVEFVVTP